LQSVAVFPSHRGVLGIGRVWLRVWRVSKETLEILSLGDLYWLYVVPKQNSCFVMKLYADISVPKLSLGCAPKVSTIQVYLSILLSHSEVI
jgi:hypothetical protein